jgi:hypothetical protein
MTTLDLAGKLTSSRIQLITEIKYTFPTSGSPHGNDEISLRS